MDPILILGLVTIAVFAGILGTVFGLGGGIIFVPVLTILFGLTANEAAAVSLIGIVATSTVAAAVYIERGTSNIRLGLLLEITTSLGAIAGAFIAAYMSDWLLLCVFAAVLIYGAIMMILKPEHVSEPSTQGKGKLDFEYTNDKGEKKPYHVDNAGSGLAMCTAAGMLSSMTGVGGGTIKVPLMNVHMHIPIKISTATSNYMIGITAFSGAIVYLLNGDVLLEYAATVAAGAFVGSVIGTKITKHVNAGPLRKYLSVVLLAISVVILLEAGGIL